MRDSRTGFILFLNFLLLSPAAMSEDNFDLEPWKAFREECRWWGVEGINDYLTEAAIWDKKNITAQNNITHFYKEACPAYLGSTNGASGIAGAGASQMTLEKFTGELQRVYSEVTQVKMGAEKNQRFLEKNIIDFGSWLNIARLGITNHPCGARFVERRNYIIKELKHLQENLNQIRLQCPKIADALAASPQQRKTSSSGPGSGTPQVSGQRPTTSGSDITGLKEDKAKAEKAAP